MFSRNLDEQTIIEISQEADLGICAEAFLNVHHVPACLCGLNLSGIGCWATQTDGAA